MSKQLRDRVVQKCLFLTKAGRFSVRLIFVVAALGITADLWASGWPPFANKDSAEVTRGGVVEELTSGADSVPPCINIARSTEKYTDVDFFNVSLLRSALLMEREWLRFR